MEARRVDERITPRSDFGCVRDELDHRGIDGLTGAAQVSEGETTLINRAPAQLSVAKSADKAIAEPGEVIEYTINVADAYRQLADHFSQR